MELLGVVDRDETLQPNTDLQWGRLSSKYRAADDAIPNTVRMHRTSAQGKQMSSATKQFS